MFCLERMKLDSKIRTNILSFLRRVDFEPRLQRFIDYRYKIQWGDTDDEEEY